MPEKTPGSKEVQAEYVKCLVSSGGWTAQLFEN
jgi:hypothetical protein